MGNLFTFVEKMWETLWESLWERRGKVIHMLAENEFYTNLVVKVGVFHGLVEKFYYWFYTRFNRYRGEFCTVSTGLTTTTTNYLEKDG